LGGGPTSNGLLKGFAVISSDAGHAMETTPIGGGVFGVDPQARLDYGYNAVAQLTPMAKNLIKTYYGKRPDKSYIVGTSNGGRHAMVAASRYAKQYDGFLAGSPGFNLPQAAVAQLWGVQQYAPISALGTNGRPDVWSSFSLADTALVSDKILAKCDGLDGLIDNMVSDPMACQSVFDIDLDVLTCPGDATHDGTCLSLAQKSVLASVHAGARNSNGETLYTNFHAPKIYATDATYTESSMSFMTPPDPLMKKMNAKGGKLIVVHGAADPVFSVADTVHWYEALTARYKKHTSDLARLFIVPGMSHSSGGPACDQYDLVDALVKWVEQGIAPDAITAKARGTGANVVNTEVPATWAPNRTRPLCTYPTVPKYNGTGNIENAENFSCVVP
ncbi:MAG: Tannase and feruloyl esterase, partial [Deltaproteobacteria bacterium]|nr:Tannase and feruloyl esterase [Deltaproteobacteria bacterium]